MRGGRRGESSKMFRGKISTPTGADVAHPGNRSQGILGAQQHLCAVHHGQKPCPYIQVRQNGSPLASPSSSTPVETPARRTKTSWRGSQTEIHGLGLGRSQLWPNADRRRGNIILRSRARVFREFLKSNLSFFLLIRFTKFSSDETERYYERKQTFYHAFFPRISIINVLCNERNCIRKCVRLVPTTFSPLQSSLSNLNSEM